MGIAQDKSSEAMPPHFVTCDLIGSPDLSVIPPPIDSHWCCCVNISPHGGNKFCFHLHFHFSLSRFLSFSLSRFLAFLAFFSFLLSCFLLFLALLLSYLSSLFSHSSLSLSGQWSCRARCFLFFFVGPAKIDGSVPDWPAQKITRIRAEYVPILLVRYHRLREPHTSWQTTFLI